jgi:hypothetical protein
MDTGYGDMRTDSEDLEGRAAGLWASLRKRIFGIEGQPQRIW